MAYIANHQDTATRVVIEEPATNQFRVLLDGREFLVDFLEPQQNLLSLIVEGRSYEVDVNAEATSDHYSVIVQGDSFEIDVLDERKLKSARKRAGAAAGRQDLKAPMAGCVRTVLVAVGDRVHAGQVLLTLEAMKMQNEITSPIDGKVSALVAREDTTVSQGDPLCIIEPVGSPPPASTLSEA
jgi:glutaconyl-CoA/methylmalonyl-CoA decarboxylase subunit gamma